MTVWLWALLACSGDPEDPALCAGEPVATLTEDGRLVVESAGCARVELTLEVQGDGVLEADWSEDAGLFTPVVEGEGRVRGVIARGTFDLAGRDDTLWWRQGYQSWAWSGVVALDDAPAVDGQTGLVLAGGDGDALSVVDETNNTSWWAGALAKPDGAALVLGPHDPELLKTWLSVRGDQVAVVWGLRGDSVPVSGELRLDPLGIAVSADPIDAWTAWGELEVAVRSGGERSVRGLAQTPPVGWSTWYQVYSDLHETFITDNLQVAAGLPAELAPLEVMQVDDGWQRLWGDWRGNERFPAGIGATATTIAEAGFTPGLWMAPLYVHREAPAYLEHDDWWVRDDAGDELRFTNLGSGDYAVLDVTHPEAEQWLRQQIRDRVEEGWGYLKLDFLYAGAQEGQRHEDVTGLQAYHRALAVMREEAGDAWVLACGAPWLPSVGYAEQYRSGADIAFEVSPDPELANLRWQARQTAARGWSNGLFWWNDADAVMVRPPLSEVEVRGTIVAQVVSGGAWLLGDDLALLDDARRAAVLDPRIVGRLGHRARPDDPLQVSGLDGSPLLEQIQDDDVVPVAWTFDDGVRAFVNLGNQPVDVVVPGGTSWLGARETVAGEVVTLQPGDGDVWDGPSE